MLATYSVPLGANEATIILTGNQLSLDDFDALADYVVIFKKQFKRKLESEAVKDAASMSDADINLKNSGG